MDTKRSWAAIGFFVVAALLVALMLTHTLHRATRITLPAEEETAAQDPARGDGEAGELTLVAVTPQTVQAAVATLERPDEYCRAVKVEQYWSGGSGSYEVTVTVQSPWSRTDRTLPDGRTRHTLTDSERAYIWYDSESTVYEAPAGSVSADREQTIPTYEDVLALPEGSIRQADYRLLGDETCIYVETGDEEDTLCYWVSTRTGLLAAAERVVDGKTAYWMESMESELRSPAAGAFALPDGRVLQGTA